jgi:hypothetical protein
MVRATCLSNTTEALSYLNLFPVRILYRSDSTTPMLSHAGGCNRVLAGSWICWFRKVTIGKVAIVRLNYGPDSTFLSPLMTRLFDTKVSASGWPSGQYFCCSLQCQLPIIPYYICHKSSSSSQIHNYVYLLLLIKN